MGKQSRQRKERRAQRQHAHDSDSEHVGVACPVLREDVGAAKIQGGNKLTFKYTEPGMVDGTLRCSECNGPMVTIGDQYACFGSLLPEELFAASISPEIDEKGAVVGGERLIPCGCCPPGQRQITLDLAFFVGDRDKLIEATKKFNVFVSLE